MIRLALIALMASSLMGCASYFKRKECEKTNWYEHGQKVAMAGKRLDADGFVKDCQKAEADIRMAELDTGFKAGMAKYCTGDNVYQVGKAGKPFSYDMCDGENEARMRARYNDGLRVFCVPENGYRFGASGGLYENVCTDKEEKAWMPQYAKGRKVYLKAVIDEKEKEVSRLGTEVARLERDQTRLAREQDLTTRMSKRTRRERVYDPVTRTYREQVTEEQDEQAKLRAQSLSSEISGVRSKIQRTEKQRADLNEELAKLRTEMATL